MPVYLLLLGSERKKVRKKKSDWPRMISEVLHAGRRPSEPLRATESHLVLVDFLALGIAFFVADFFAIVKDFWAVKGNVKWTVKGRGEGREWAGQQKGGISFDTYDVFFRVSLPRVCSNMRPV